MPSYSWRLPSALAPFVRSCVGYDYRLDPAATHHGLPSTSGTVIIAFDEPLDCGWLDRPASARRFETLVSGLHRRPALIRTHGHQVGVQVALTPRGLRALTGLPGGVLADQLLDADECRLLPSGLHDRLQHSSWRDRLSAIEATLASRLTDATDEWAPEVVRAWNRLTAPRPPSVAAVADEVGWSRRHLLNRFTQAFGQGPDVVRRLARFERAHRSAATGTPLARVAADCGYADQSHLSREWQGFAGSTARQTLAEFPTVQANLPAEGS